MLPQTAVFRDEPWRRDGRTPSGKDDGGESPA
jgi:hypothetical protein